jgi:hypothetical protein
VAKGSFVLLFLAFSAAVCCAQVSTGSITGSEPDLKAAYVGSAVACSLSEGTIVVPRQLLERAKTRARLMSLLRESLYDDAKGIVNIEREREIKKLADKVRNAKAEY